MAVYNINSVWGQKTFCVVTGASKGIGREIAVQFAAKVATGSVFLLLARNENGLKSTKTKIEEICSGINVKNVSIDLGKPDKTDFLLILQACLQDFRAKAKDFKHAILVHNAGSLQANGYVSEFQDSKVMSDYYNLNIISPVILNWSFLQIFNDKTQPSRTIVQISSKAGISPFKGFGLYCSGKASRDMIFRVLAEEDSSILVLNYAPGPIDTDMYSEGSKSRDSEVAEIFRVSKAEGKLLTCEQTVGRLANLLQDKKFKSGDHIDYYDNDI